MRLLVSVTRREEALEAVAGGADILDVKNPKEGSLGASFPHIIREVRGVALPPLEVSATLGDLPHLPGTASLAAFGAASSGAQYVKAGLYGSRRVEEAVELVQAVSEAVKNTFPSVKVIAAAYADHASHRSLDSAHLPSVARKAGADGVLVDVKEKGAGCLFDFLMQDELQGLVDEAHGQGLLVALAGSLGPSHVKAVASLGADIIGVRGAVCGPGGRVDGRVERGRIAEMARATRRL